MSTEEGGKDVSGWPWKVAAAAAGAVAAVGATVWYLSGGGVGVTSKHPPGWQPHFGELDVEAMLPSSSESWPALRSRLAEGAESADPVEARKAFEAGDWAQAVRLLAAALGEEEEEGRGAEPEGDGPKEKPVILFPQASQLELLAPLSVALGHLLQPRESAWIALRVLQAAHLDLTRELRIDFFRTLSSACSVLEYYELALHYLTQSRRLTAPTMKPDIYAASIVFTEGETLDTYAMNFQKTPDHPFFRKLCHQALERCDEARRILDSLGAKFARELLFVRPEQLKISIYSTLGDLDMAEASHELYLDRLKELGILISPIRMAQYYEAYCRLCLERPDRQISLKKAADAYNAASQCFSLVGGLAGLKYQYYGQAELGVRIFARDDPSARRQMLEEPLDFIFSNRLGAPMMENDELRTEQCRLEYLETTNPGDPVQCDLLIDVRCKRHVAAGKRSRLPPGVVLKLSVALWDDADDESKVLPGSRESFLCNEKMLESESRKDRVAHFRLNSLALKAAVYVCRIEAVHQGRVLSRLDQMIPSYVAVDQISPGGVPELVQEMLRSAKSVEEKSF